MTAKTKPAETKPAEGKHAEGKSAETGTAVGGKYYVYLLLCADGSYYCGSTNDPEKRLQAHNSGRGAKYTRSRGPCSIAYLEEFDSKNEAMSREWHLKKLTHREREMLANGK